MANTTPFHSVKVHARNVYHDDTRCTEGNNIEPEYKRRGTGNRPRCEHCNKLSGR